MAEKMKPANAMACDEVADLLYLFITNELEDSESEQVATHLVGCPDCRQSMAEHVKLSGSLRRNMSGIPLRYFSENN